MSKKTNSNPENITVVITNASTHWSYFQYFIFGLHKLETLNFIKLKFRCGLLYRLSKINTFNGRLNSILFKMINLTNVRINKRAYCLEGYVLFNKTKKSFCIDCADSPFLLDLDLLKSKDIYFKMNCPKDINFKGFTLTNNIFIKYCYTSQDNEMKDISEVDFQNNVRKIYPLMQGFRKLGRNNSYSELKKGYDNYKESASRDKSKKLMCYFGNSLGPKKAEDFKIIDLNNEGVLLAYYGAAISHPNEKRAIVAEIINKLGEQYEARIINNSNSDAGGQKTNKDLIIPIEKFCNHISNFEYNMNIAGYRNSIPNRFIESFIVGTGIVTDKLFVKWYLPFDKEVVELNEMGYLPKDQINWDNVEDSLKMLPDLQKEYVLDQFNTKWAPEKVAKYIIDTIRKAL